MKNVNNMDLQSLIMQIAMKPREKIAYILDLKSGFYSEILAKCLIRNFKIYNRGNEPKVRFNSLDKLKCKKS
jgi:hypothetical protein